MADPATLALVAAGVKAVGSLVTGFGQAAAEENNAAIAEQNRKIAINQAAADESKVRRQVGKQQGQLRADIGSSGFDSGAGFGDILADSAIEGELEALTVRHQGQLKVRGFAIERDQAKHAAKLHKVGAVLGAGTSLLGGASEYQQIKQG